MTTPPPQGQNPYGQPQGGNPYGEQAAQGYPQQQPSPYMQGGPAAPPPAGNRSKFKNIKNVALIVVGVLVIGGGWIASRDDAQAAEVGDCMSIGDETSSTNPDLEVVECGDSKAKYKVVQKKEGTSGGCDRTRYSEYTQSGDGDSFTLCLEDYAK